MHTEKYQNYSDVGIREIYSQKESLPENIKYISENNKSTLAQVFTDIRYKKADNEYFSDKLIEVIRRQGFKI